MTRDFRPLALHLGLIALLLALNFMLPDYHHGNLARIMVLASFAMGYNLLFGYAGLLSLGHALYFAAGMYGMGLAMHALGWSAGPALLAGLVSALAMAALTGFLALRTSGVAFMIVTLMFAQAFALTILLFSEITGGDQGFVIAQSRRALFGIDLTSPANRFLASLLLFSAVLLTTLGIVRSRFGRVLVAIRENEERARMLGYDVFRRKLAAVIVSGGISGAAGAAYGLLFGYAGASFASVQYSIYPLLWVLVGGAGTTLGPFAGALFMFYLIDLSSGLTNAWMLITGAALVLVTLYARQGIFGLIRERAVKWLP